MLVSKTHLGLLGLLFFGALGLLIFCIKRACQSKSWIDSVVACLLFIDIRLSLSAFILGCSGTAQRGNLLHITPYYTS